MIRTPFFVVMAGMTTLATLTGSVRGGHGAQPAPVRGGHIVVGTPSVAQSLAERPEATSGGRLTGYLNEQGGKRLELLGHLGSDSLSRRGRSGSLVFLITKRQWEYRTFPSWSLSANARESLDAEELADQAATKAHPAEWRLAEEYRRWDAHLVEQLAALERDGWGLCAHLVEEHLVVFSRRK